MNKFSVPDADGPVFYYEPPSNVSFGAGPPNVPDPYEAKMVEVKVSSIHGSGEGVYVRKDVPAWRTVAFYSGLIIQSNDEGEIYSAATVNNESMSDEYRRACKKYSLGLTNYLASIEIPPELDLPEIFHPTVGPKVNHHFRLNNAFYSEVEHPRWGTIQSITTTKPIKAGEEIFTYYGYLEKAPFPSDFLWYWEALAEIERQEALEKAEKDKEKTSEEKGRKKNKLDKRKMKRKAKVKKFD